MPQFYSYTTVVPPNVHYAKNPVKATSVHKQMAPNTRIIYTPG